MIDLLIGNTVLKDIGLIIFDKDGTLFEMYPYWNTIARKRASRISQVLGIDGIRRYMLEDTIMRSMGVDTGSRCMFSKGPIGIYGRDVVIREVMGCLKGYGISKREIVKCFSDTDADISNGAIHECAFVPIKGIKEFLGTIRYTCKTAIFSYDQTKNIEFTLGVSGLSDSFDLVVGGDQTPLSKPNPYGARFIMKQLNISPANTIFIGDSIYDMLCGKNAGCKYIIAMMSEVTGDTTVEISDYNIKDYTEIAVGEKCH